MKKLFLILAAATIVLTLVALPGCQTSPTKAAYTSEAAAHISVDAAMTGWGNYVAQYHPPAEDERLVKSYYERYQAAQLAAIDATQIYVVAAGTTNAVPLELQMQAAANAAAQALADLVNLLNLYGVAVK